MFAIIKARGFTIIEILVVMGIIAVLTSAITVYSLGSYESSRNNKRQSDLTMLKNAVEQYKLRYGRYPAGCNGANNWSGELGGAFACGSGVSVYITGLAPEFIQALPRDPRRTRATQGGYTYVTNAAGTVYKIMAMSTVEGAPVREWQQFKSCDFVNVSNNDIRVDGLCGALYNTSNTLIQTESNAGHQCHPNSNRFQTSYAVWGGFASLQGTPSNPLPANCTIGSGGWCVNPNPPDVTADPLDSFIFTGSDGSVQLSTDASPFGSVKNRLRAEAVHGTTQIICK